MPKPYTAADVAEKLGLSVDTFYRRREALHADDELPRPIMRGRPYKWDRATLDAWLGRNHPLAPKYPAANDSAPIGLPANDDDQRALLATYYGRPH